MQIVKHFLQLFLNFSEGISRRHPLYILTHPMTTLGRTHWFVQEVLRFYLGRQRKVNSIARKTFQQWL